MMWVRQGTSFIWILLPWAFSSCQDQPFKSRSTADSEERPSHLSQSSDGGLTASGRSGNSGVATCRCFRCFAPWRIPPATRNSNAYREWWKMNVSWSWGLSPPGNMSPRPAQEHKVWINYWNSLNVRKTEDLDGWRLPTVTSRDYLLFRPYAGGGCSRKHLYVNMVTGLLHRSSSCSGEQGAKCPLQAAQSHLPQGPSQDLPWTLSCFEMSEGYCQKISTMQEAWLCLFESCSPQRRHCPTALELRRAGDWIDTARLLRMHCSLHQSHPSSTLNSGSLICHRY